VTATAFLSLSAEGERREGVAFLDSGARATVINRAFAKAAGIDPDS
jgi:hypothetical protein